MFNNEFKTYENQEDYLYKYFLIGDTLHYTTCIIDRVTLATVSLKINSELVINLKYLSVNVNDNISQEQLYGCEITKKEANLIIKDFNKELKKWFKYKENAKIKKN